MPVTPFHVPFKNTEYKFIAFSESEVAIEFLDNK